MMSNDDFAELDTTEDEFAAMWDEAGRQQQDGAPPSDVAPWASIVSAPSPTFSTSGRTEPVSAPMRSFAHVGAAVSSASSAPSA